MDFLFFTKFGDLFLKFCLYKLWHAVQVEMYQSELDRMEELKIKKYLIWMVIWLSLRKK